VEKEDIYDAAIVGGEQAGSTAATSLANGGRRVIVMVAAITLPLVH